MTGSFSPEAGIVRLSIAEDSLFVCVCAAPIGKMRLAVLAPINLAASRRVIRHLSFFSQQFAKIASLRSE
jgi:hypothetical protein